ncbi:MAG: DedA family protein [Candidatus Ancillula sp.]|jgi:membrane protein DedA with SNARE-associated domain|nr:DedA family protein [Candidatus Ancillula sp.]
MEYCEASGIIGYFVDFALNLIGALGYIGAMLVVAVENVLPFIPSEVILPAIGMASERGVFPITGALGVVVSVLLVTAASIIGALILFGISRLIGEERVAKLPFIKPEAIAKADRWFAKYGAFAVFICRIIPVVRVLITIPAGISKMKLSSFVIFSTLGSLIWNTALVGVGVAVGSAWCDVEPVFSKFAHITVLVLLVVLILAIVLKKKLLKGGADTLNDENNDQVVKGVEVAKNAQDDANLLAKNVDDASNSMQKGDV